MGLGNNRHAKFQAGGRKLYSEVGSTFGTLISLNGDVVILVLMNTLDAALVLEFPNESGVIEFVLPARVSVSFDFTANGMQVAKGLIRVKYETGAPTEGMISVLPVLA